MSNTEAIKYALNISNLDPDSKAMSLALNAMNLGA